MKKHVFKIIFLLFVFILVVIQSIFVYRGTNNVPVTFITAAVVSIIAILLGLNLHINTTSKKITNSYLSQMFKPIQLKYDENNKFYTILRSYSYFAKLEDAHTIVINVFQSNNLITTIKTNDFDWFSETFMPQNNIL